MSMRETGGVVLLREKKAKGRCNGHNSFQVFNRQLQKTKDMNSQNLCFEAGKWTFQSTSIKLYVKRMYLHCCESATK